jgi:RNA polymerase sigma-70 factor (ECF subfamily)
VLNTTNGRMPGEGTTAVGVDAVPGDHHVLAAQAGDEAAFVVLYRHVQPGLLRYLSLLVGDDNEDLAAETWAHVCRDLHRFSGTLDNFRGWVATIGRHRALDHLRYSRRRPSVPYAPEDMPVPPPERDSGELALEEIATRDALRMISLLPRDQAEAVLLRAVVGLDANSAGDVLGKRAGAVRTAAHRGLRTLARRLADDPFAADHLTRRDRL